MLKQGFAASTGGAASETSASVDPASSATASEMTASGPAASPGPPGDPLESKIQDTSPDTAIPSNTTTQIFVVRVTNLCLRGYSYYEAYHRWTACGTRSKAGVPIPDGTDSSLRRAWYVTLTDWVTPDVGASGILYFFREKTGNRKKDVLARAAGSIPAGSIPAPGSRIPENPHPILDGVDPEG